MEGKCHTSLLVVILFVGGRYFNLLGGLDTAVVEGRGKNGIDAAVAKMEHRVAFEGVLLALADVPNAHLISGDFLAISAAVAALTLKGSHHHAALCSNLLALVIVGMGIHVKLTLQVRLAHCRPQL